MCVCVFAFMLTLHQPSMAKTDHNFISYQLLHMQEVVVINTCMKVPIVGGCVCVCTRPHQSRGELLYKLVIQECSNNIPFTRPPYPLTHLSLIRYLWSITEVNNAICLITDLVCNVHTIPLLTISFTLNILTSIAT